MNALIQRLCGSPQLAWRLLAQRAAQKEIRPFVGTGLFLAWALALPGSASGGAASTNITPGPLVVETEFFSGFGWNRRELEPKAPSVSFWLESSLKRVFPTSLPGNCQTLDQLTPRNARFSFQACLRNDRSWPAEVECAVTGADDLRIQVRRVGFVPQWNYTGDTPTSELDGLDHIPGLVPDPLFPESKATVGPFAAQSFWITAHVPPQAKPGPRTLMVRFTSPVLKRDANLTVRVEIGPLVVQPRKQFPVTHWWNADAIYDWHKQPVQRGWIQAVRVAAFLVLQGRARQSLCGHADPAVSVEGGARTIALAQRH
jgi:hypothetical protein